MRLLKSALIFFSFAVLMFVAKPFIGFRVFKELNHIKHISICVKAFTKRKQEYVEESSLDIQTVLKKLKKPLDFTLLSFSVLLGIVMPLVSRAQNLSNRLLRQLQCSLSPSCPSYLLHGNLIIWSRGNLSFRDISFCFRATGGISSILSLLIC